MRLVNLAHGDLIVLAAFLVLGLSGIVIVPLGLWSFGLAYAHRESRIPRPSTRI